MIGVSAALRTLKTLEWRKQVVSVIVLPQALRVSSRRVCACIEHSRMASRRVRTSEDQNDVRASLPRYCRL